MKFKILSIFICVLFTQLVMSQQVAPSKSMPVHIEGLVVGAYNTEFNITNQSIQRGTVPVATFKTDEKGGFIVDFTIPFADYFLLRAANGQALNLVLKGDDNIKIYADIKSFVDHCNIIGSDDSDKMKEFYQAYIPFKNFEDSLRNVLKQNPSAQGKVNAVFKPRAEQFYQYRNSFIQSQTDSPALLAVIIAVNQETEFALYKQLITRLNTVFPTSPTVIAINKQLASIEAQKLSSQKIGPGKPAPEIVVNGIDGKPIKLSDLRGKVVLIDMWASWCGPCRRENPNVVAAYNKYNKDGFEVFSVSFDKPGMKDRWLAAIKQDGLIWPNHGSDLNGFNNQAARDYSVKGIPFTCLVDAEGNIIATNLRGPQLEAELKKIFGH